MKGCSEKSLSLRGSPVSWGFKGTQPRCPDRKIAIAALSNANTIVRFEIAERSAKLQPNRL